MLSLFHTIVPPFHVTSLPPPITFLNVAGSHLRPVLLEVREGEGRETAGPKPLLIILSGLLRSDTFALEVVGQAKVIFHNRLLGPSLLPPFACVETMQITLVTVRGRISKFLKGLV